MKTRADGNCIFRSILKAFNLSVESHLELRQWTSDLIRNSNLENSVFSEYDCTNKEDYANLISRNKQYGGYITNADRQTIRNLVRSWN